MSLPQKGEPVFANACESTSGAAVRRFEEFEYSAVVELAKAMLGSIVETFCGHLRHCLEQPSVVRPRLTIHSVFLRI